MDSKIEKLIILAGDKHKYQYLTLLITFFIWTNSSLLPISLAYLEREPEVIFKNPNTGEVVKTQLNYTICDYGKEHYTVSESYEYSWVIEFDITCDRVTTGLIGSIMFTGDLLGAILFKLFADKLGRKPTSLIGVGILVTSLISFTFCTNIIPVLILIFIGGFSSTLIALGSFLLATETVSSEKRAFFGALLGSAFSVSGVMYILLYKFLNSWRIVFFIAAALSTLETIIFFFLTIESSRFYLTSRKYKKFISTLKYIAKVNNKLETFEMEISSEESEYKVIIDEVKLYLENTSIDISIQKISDSENITDTEKDLATKSLLNIKDNTNKGNSQQVSVFALVKYASIRYKFLILCFFWFCSSGNYYGLSIFLKKLPGDIYMNGISIYTFESFSYFLAGYVGNLKWVGRKGIILAFDFIAIVGFSVLVLVDMSDFWIVMTTFIARFAVAGVFNILFFYSVEVYPTCIRAFGLGINSSSARIAGMLFPLLIELFAEYITSLFVIMNVLCFLFMFFMPETNGKTLKENFEEEEEQTINQDDK